MAIFILQGRFTSQYIKGGVAAPEDRRAVMSRLCEQAGGKLISLYYTDLRKFLDTSVLSISGHGSIAGHLLSGRNRSPGDRAQRADQAVVGGEPVPGHLAGVHDIRQATKHRVGEPVAAQIVPNPLDRIELRAVRRQRQQSDIAGDYQALAAVPTGTIQDHHGMGIGGDLTADLAEMVVHGNGIADRHDQRRCLALRRTDRTKHIGRGEAEILRCRRPTAGLPPHPGQAVLLADASLVLKPHLDSFAAHLRRPDSL